MRSRQLLQDAGLKYKKEEADMATGAQLKAIRKYDDEHTKQIVLKLNLKTDADILERLAEVGNKQGYIKDLIRHDINKK